MRTNWSSKHGWVLGILVAGLGCGPDASGGTEGSGSSGSGDTGSSSGGTTMSPTTMPMTSNADSDTTNAEVTTEPPSDTTSFGSSGTPDTEGSSSGGPPPGPAYPACDPAGDPCPEPYDQCVAINGGPAAGSTWCSLACMDAAECPVPDSGTAEVVCAGPPMQPTRCELDCSMGDCPDGMDCVGLGPMGTVMRCMWPPA